MGGDRAGSDELPARIIAGAIVSASGDAIGYRRQFVSRDPSPSVPSSRPVAVALAIIFGVLSYFTVKVWTPPPSPIVQGKLPPQPSSLIPADEAATQAAIRFYLGRVERDPEDARSQNALAEYYLQRVRESGNEDDLPLAIEAARASLAAVVPERNVSGLTALAHAEFANHAFAAARDHALQLTQLDPRKSEPYAILGDADLELGDYEEAAKAFDKMRDAGENDAGKEIRFARLAILRGATAEARQHFTAALAFLLALPEPPHETMAWCQWQLGETAFAEGNYSAAEDYDREALKAAPNYFRALASIGRVRAARGDMPAAFDYYEQAVRLVPVLDFMAALGDLYQLAGREKEAAVRYELVQQLGEHSQKVHGTPYDRRLALFFADHDLKAPEAYALARGEFDAGRHDIYGADALAWTALKAGRIAEAQSASKEALRLGTADPRLCYHAGVIACAAGDKVNGEAYLRRALALSPHFDPIQSDVAREALRQ